jgi:histone H3/H4
MSEENAESKGSSEDVLVVVSKLKSYIRSKSDMNTSGNVAPCLSSIVRQLCDKAIERAKSDNRKTVMERDFTEAAQQ